MARRSNDKSGDDGATALGETRVFQTETVRIDDLREHPRNYREHPQDQIEHIVQSIRDHGLYRNVVIARDGTLLAGHGVVAALRTIGQDTVAVFRLDVEPDSPQALKLLAADNELGHLGAVNDRALTEILREIRQSHETGLLGTGFDDAMLANLVMVTRSASEIADFDEAAEWVGMPAYHDGAEEMANDIRLTLSFATEEARQAFADQIGITMKTVRRHLNTWATAWPQKDAKDDLISIKFVPQLEPNRDLADV